MLLDAHNHLHDARLAPWREAIFAELEAIDLRAAVVNGTSERDWGDVAALSAQKPWVIPSFGLHPWHVNDRNPRWRDALAQQLAAHPAAGVGEIGLDRWVKGHDFDAQLECFRFQLQLAARENRAVTIHCIQAWGALQESLAAGPLPERGFLIHAYGGSLEMVKPFADRGAYFSFSTYFLHPRKTAQREVFRQVPAGRLLVETDSPDLAPPDEKNPRPLGEPGAARINHPANLDLAYTALAEMRGWTLEETKTQIGENFARLFQR